MRRNHYCFTWHDVDSIPLFDEEMVYLIYQCERCPETGKLHYQGYVEFKKPMRLGAAKTALGSDKVHLEARRGTREEARDYCKKDESRVDGPWEFGEWHEKGQGRRSDLEAVVEDIKAKKSIKEIAENHTAAYVRYYKGIENARNLIVNEKRNPEEPVHNVILFGDAGMGKTRYVMSKHPGAYTSYMAPGWWQRYNGEDVALYDDFDGKPHMDISWFKRITDRYPVTVPAKNGDKEYRSSWNYFTSNTYPIEWYERQHWDAIKRRFDHMIWWRDGDIRCDVCLDGCVLVEELRNLIY